MQKKIIALAVAGLVSGAAFAQSSVTISGIMDMGYQYSWGETNGTKSMSQIKSGWDGSRVGFHGVEDLGNGLKVGFDATAGFNIDNGKSYGDALMSEGSSVYAANAKWGTLRAGYFGSFLDSDVSALDVSGRHGITAANNLIATGKLANHVNWISPNWSGFTLAAGFSSNAQGNNNDVAAVQDPVLKAGVNVRAYEIGATYKNGDLGLGAGYIAYQPQNNFSVSANEYGDSYEWQAGAMYDFKVVAVSLYYAATHQDRNAAWSPTLGSEDVEKSGAWALGLAVPITKVDNITFSYADRKTEFFDDAQEDDKTHGFGLFYTHNLSKRTALYGIVGAYGGDSKYVLDGQYKNGVAFGLHHTF